MFLIIGSNDYDLKWKENKKNNNEKDEYKEENNSSFIEDEKLFVHKATMDTSEQKVKTILTTTKEKTTKEE
ncbi:hypothetical protein Glove_209g29 [Diversispora epigaea]|uniref:Uncharacterized protein n=1 Tax=Diversispora epigaea TaxID=1348612 RepID=A0A397IIS4_9GLOM|nr:hypothetical protein Glove_209g29 [Diversispora epigaea]